MRLSTTTHLLFLSLSMLVFTTVVARPQKNNVFLRDQATARIVGGVDQTEELPYYVHAIARTLCGGTLIHADVVLTAAHCGDVWSGTVQIGGTTIRQGTKQAVVEATFPHPDYQGGTTEENDIMLVKLTAPVDDVTPVTLNRNDNVPVAGTNTTVVGYGQTEENGPIASTLQTITLNTVSAADCDQSLPGIAIFSESQICAGGVEGFDSCGGDSGGPLLDTTNKNLQYGVVSFGVGCAREDNPGVYTRVSHYADFIDAFICTNSTVPPDTCDNTTTAAPTSSPDATVDAPTLTPVAFTFAPTDSPVVANTPTLTPVVATFEPTSAPAAVDSPTLTPVAVTFAPTSSPVAGNVPTLTPVAVTFAPTSTPTSAPVAVDSPTFTPVAVTSSPLASPTTSAPAPDIPLTNQTFTPTGAPTSNAVVPTAGPTRSPSGSSKSSKKSKSEAKKTVTPSPVAADAPTAAPVTKAPTKSTKARMATKAAKSTKSDTPTISPVADDAPTTAPITSAPVTTKSAKSAKSTKNVATSAPTTNTITTTTTRATTTRRNRRRRRRRIRQQQARNGRNLSHAHSNGP